MVTLPLAQLVSRWTSDLRVGGSRPVSDTLGLNPISQVSDGSLTDICCHKQDATIPSEILPSSFKVWLPQFSAKPKIN